MIFKKHRLKVKSAGKLSFKRVFELFVEKIGFVTAMYLI